MQQLNRCRNINSVHYFVRSNNGILFKNINEIKNEANELLNNYKNFSNNINVNIIKENGFHIENNGNIIIDDNAINELYYQNLYLNNILNSAKKYHFNRFLLQKGFIINYIKSEIIPDIAELKIKNKIITKNVEIESEKITNKIIYNIINNKLQDVENNNNIPNLNEIKIYSELVDKIVENDGDQEIDIKYIKKKEDILNKIKILNLKNIDESQNGICIAILNNSDILKDEYSFNAHLNLRLIIKEEETINDMFNNAKYNKDFAIHQSKANLTKLSIIRQIEKFINIKPLEIIEIEDNLIIDLNDNIYKIACTLFRINVKEKPNTKYKIFCMIAKMYNTLLGMKLYESKAIRKYKKKINETDKDRVYVYNLNYEILHNFFDCYKYSNPQFEKIDEHILKLMNLR
jgi:hypothetical protein